jgi:NCS1 family nucleobase:cation symporter-1
MMPWKLMATFGSYYLWVAGGLLGTAGAGGWDHGDRLLPDSGTRLDTYSLYRRGGIYEYRNGLNPAAIVALVLGIAAALVGVCAAGVAFLYDYAWFVGFFLSGAIYYLMMIGHRTTLAEVEGIDDECW